MLKELIKTLKYPYSYYLFSILLYGGSAIAIYLGILMHKRSLCRSTFSYRDFKLLYEKKVLYLILLGYPIFRIRVFLESIFLYTTFCYLNKLYRRMLRKMHKMSKRIAKKSEEPFDIQRYIFILLRAGFGKFRVIWYSTGLGYSIKEIIQHYNLLNGAEESSDSQFIPFCLTKKIVDVYYNDLKRYPYLKLITWTIVSYNKQGKLKNLTLEKLAQEKNISIHVLYFYLTKMNEIINDLANFFHSRKIAEIVYSILVIEYFEPML